MSAKSTKRPRKSVAKKNPKNSSKQSFTKIFVAIFVLVMIGWTVLVTFVKMPEKSPLEHAKSSENIHKILESKKNKTSILDKKSENSENSKLNISENSENSKPENSNLIDKNITDKNTTDPNNTDEKLKEFSKKIQNYKNEFIASYETNQTKEHAKAENPIYTEAKNEYKVPLLTALKSHKKADVKQPKLVIIMDDISTAAHVASLKELKKLGIKVTPSIFPPQDGHPNSHKLASEFSSYLVHLPLSAINYSNEKANTLRPGDSKEKIEQRIAQIKSDFKDVKFINNHTGSAFTSDYKSSEMLLQTLKKYDIKFVDSLTISKSQIPAISANLGLRYIYRDVFLDNEQNVGKITTMLQNAVNIAKTDGVAIAICHPYKSTFEALRQARNGALKGVEVVYINKVYELYK